MSAQLDLATNRLKKVEVMKDETREEAIKRGLDAQDYVDAKREFETDQELLQTMKLKQMAETISGKMPGESVQVHDEPVIADSSGESECDAQPGAWGGGRLDLRRRHRVLPRISRYLGEEP